MVSAKSFLKTYGIVGVSVYGAVTAVSITSIYFVLRMGGDRIITAPLEQVMGKDSDVVRKLHQQLGEANKHTPSDGAAVVKGEGNENKWGEINFVREGTYLGIASLIDSLVLPVKLMVCLPITKYILTRRGGILTRRRGR